MDASKETAKKAKQDVMRAANLLDAVTGSQPWRKDEVKMPLERVAAFLEAAEQKLPTGRRKKTA